MERLTDERIAEIARDKYICEFCEDCGEDEVCIRCERVKPITPAELKLFWQELTALVQAEREGRLVELPCKVGDVVYNADHWGRRVAEFQVRWVTYDGEKVMCWEHHDYQPITPDIWGKTVFLTRTEAEAALAAQEGGSHEADTV